MPEDRSYRSTHLDLCRDSKQELEKALAAWLAWHVEHHPKQSFGATLSGTLEFSPQSGVVGQGAAWKDVPSIDEQSSSDPLSVYFNTAYERESGVPAYDRAAPLLEDAGPARTQKGTALPSKPSLPDQRCFNCGSYTHNLQGWGCPWSLCLYLYGVGYKGCWKPVDRAAVAAARSEFQGSSSGRRDSFSRYFVLQQQAGKEYAGLVPGKLSPDVRKALGISKTAPPPWLHTMRQLGIPPDYRARPAGSKPPGPADGLVFLQGDPGPSPTQAAEAAQGPQDLSTGLGSHRASPGLATDQSLEPPGLDAPTQEDGSSDMDLENSGSLASPPGLSSRASGPGGQKRRSSGIGGPQGSVSKRLRTEGAIEGAAPEVEFPGINAPLPPGADPAAWGLNPLTGAPFAPLNTPGHPPGPPGLPPGPPGPDYAYGMPPRAPTSLPPGWGPFHAGLSHSHLPGHPVQQQYGLQSQGGVGLSHVASQQPQGAAEPSTMYQQPGGPMDQTLHNPTWNPGQQHARYFPGHLPYHQQQHSSSHQQQHHPPSFGHAPGMHDPGMQMGSPPPGFLPPPHLPPSFHGVSPPFEHRRSGGYRR